MKPRKMTEKNWTENQWGENSGSLIYQWSPLKWGGGKIFEND